MKRVLFFIAAATIQFSMAFAQTDLSEPREIRFMLRQPPRQIFDSIGIRQGMTIGEVGAGRGRFTVYLAREVGNEGKVYANDISESSLAYLNQRIIKMGLSNVETILGKENDPLFPVSSLDMVFMVWVYHGIDNSDELLKSFKKYLKPGGRVIIIDPHDFEIDAEYKIDRSKPDPRFPPIRERIERSTMVCGYKLLKTHSFLTTDYIFELEVR